MGAWIGGGSGAESRHAFTRRINYLLMKALATCWQRGVFLVCLFVYADSELMAKSDDQILTAPGYEDRAW